MRALLARGDRVRVTVRPRTRQDNLLGLDVEQVGCDILDRGQVRSAMAGVERVFHVAGQTSLRASPDALFRVNVEGTRIVMEEALRAGVERVVHTPSVAAIVKAKRATVIASRDPFPRDGARRRRIRRRWARCGSSAIPCG